MSLHLMQCDACFTDLTADLGLTLQPMIPISEGYIINSVELENHKKLLIGTGNSKTKLYDIQSQGLLKEENYPNVAQSICKAPKSGKFMVLCLDKNAYMVSEENMAIQKKLFTFHYSGNIPRLASHGDLDVMSNPNYRGSNQQ